MPSIMVTEEAAEEEGRGNAKCCTRTIEITLNLSRLHF